MLRLAVKLVDIAEELAADLVFSFRRDTSKGLYPANSLYGELQSYLDRIRQNEGLTCVSFRRDKPGEMLVGVSISEHDQKAAILKGLQERAEKLARTHEGIELAETGNSAG